MAAIGLQTCPHDEPPTGSEVVRSIIAGPASRARAIRKALRPPILSYQAAEICDFRNCIGALKSARHLRF